MRSLLTYLIFIFVITSGSLFAQNRSNFIKVATIDVDYIFGKLKEDPTLVKVIMKRTQEDFREIELIGKELEKLKEDIVTKNQTPEAKTQMQLKITQDEQAIKTYFERVTSYNLYDAETLKAIYFYIKKSAELKGVSLLLEKNASVIFATEEADITQVVMEELLKLKQKLGM